MRTTGRVRIWHHSLGWGVLESEDVPDGCWAERADLRIPAGERLERGDGVIFDCLRPGRDGYEFRAVAVWRDDVEPDAPVVVDPVLEPRSFRSHASIRFEE